MQKHNVFTHTFLLFLCPLLIFSTGCESNKRDLIMKVYVPDNRPEVVLFDTESKKGQILIEDKKMVFLSYDVLTQEWTVVSEYLQTRRMLVEQEEKLLFTFLKTSGL